MAKIINDTGRIVLRELQTSDASFMLQLLNSEGWLQHIGDRNVHTPGEAETYLANGALASYRENGFGLWLVEEKKSGEAVGIPMTPSH